MRRFFGFLAAAAVFSGCARNEAAADNTVRVLPDVAFARLGGGEERPARIRGKIVVVNMWATWCPPCREELPAFDRLAREERGRAVFFAIDEAEDAKRVAKTVANLRVREMHVLLDPDQQYGAKFVTMGLPTTIVVDRNGKVRARFYGAPGNDQVRAAIRKAEAFS